MLAEDTVNKSFSASYWNAVPRKMVLIVTSWRSGSTFLGEMLAQHPTIFYHYEPLWYEGDRQIRNKSNAAAAVDHLRNLFHCK